MAISENQPTDQLPPFNSNKFVVHKPTSVLVQSLGELVDRRGNLQTLPQDDLLALETDILGPLDETAKVTLGLNVLACDR